ncbi:photosystem I P700 chlorophyll A apoprotein A1 [Tanacetum coccineum]
MGGSAISYGHRHPSGRGYWQELIESIVWAHNKLKVAPATQPRALSIVQGRAIEVTHYLLGGIATTWAFFLLVSQCQCRPSRVLSPLVFFLISTHFTAPLEIPSAPTVLQLGSFHRLSRVEPWDLTADLKSHLQTLYA